MLRPPPRSPLFPYTTLFRSVHAMRDATEVLNAEMTVQEALEKSRSSKLRAWPVCEERGVIGVISVQKLKRLNNDGLGSSRLSEFAVADNFPHVHSDHQLNMDLDHMVTR